MLKLKKKDTVIVLAGRDKGKNGEIKEIKPEARKVVVMGTTIVHKHKKTTKEKPGGIHKMEAPMAISNVQLVCPKCNKQSKVKVSVQGGEKMRFCKKCGEAIV